MSRSTQEEYCNKIHALFEKHFPGKYGKNYVQNLLKANAGREEQVYQQFLDQFGESAPVTPDNDETSIQARGSVIIHDEVMEATSNESKGNKKGGSNSRGRDKKHKKGGLSAIVANDANNSNNSNNSSNSNNSKTRQTRNQLAPQSNEKSKRKSKHQLDLEAFEKLLTNIEKGVVIKPKTQTKANTKSSNKSSKSGKNSKNSASTNNNSKTNDKNEKQQLTVNAKNNNNNNNNNNKKKLSGKNSTPSTPNETVTKNKKNNSKQANSNTTSSKKDGNTKKETSNKKENKKDNKKDKKEAKSSKSKQGNNENSSNNTTPNESNDTNNNSNNSNKSNKSNNSNNSRNVKFSNNNNNNNNKKENLEEDKFVTIAQSDDNNENLKGPTAVEPDDASEASEFTITESMEDTFAQAIRDMKHNTMAGSDANNENTSGNNDEFEYSAVNVVLRVRPVNFMEMEHETRLLFKVEFDMDDKDWEIFSAARLELIEKNSKKETDVVSWDVEEVCDWFESIKLDGYKARCRRKKVNGEYLLDIPRYMEKKPLELDNRDNFVVAFKSHDQSHKYDFDKVFMPNNDNNFVFNSLGPNLVSDLIEGYNVTIFAYGKKFFFPFVYIALHCFILFF